MPFVPLPRFDCDKFCQQKVMRLSAELHAFAFEFGR